MIPVAYSYARVSKSDRAGRSSSSGISRATPLLSAWQDRLSRNFDEGVDIQAELTRKEIWIIAIWENIDTRDDRAGAKYFRRMTLAQGAYQADSTGEHSRTGLGRVRVEGKRLGRPQALTEARAQEAWRIYTENPSIRRTARIMNVSQGAVKKALGLDS